MRNILLAKEHVGLVPPNRCTGRTTALAFKTIYRAMTSPNTKIEIEDHHVTMSSNRHLMEQIRKILRQTEMKGFDFNQNHRTGVYTIEFKLWVPE